MQFSDYIGYVIGFAAAWVFFTRVFGRHGPIGHLATALLCFPLCAMSSVDYITKILPPQGKSIGWYFPPDATAPWHFDLGGYWNAGASGPTTGYGTFLYIPNPSIYDEVVANNVPWNTPVDTTGGGLGVAGYLPWAGYAQGYVFRDANNVALYQIYSFTCYDMNTTPWTQHLLVLIGHYNPLHITVTFDGTQITDLISCTPTGTNSYVYAWPVGTTNFDNAHLDPIFQAKPGPSPGYGYYGQNNGCLVWQGDGPTTAPATTSTTSTRPVNVMELPWYEQTGARLFGGGSDVSGGLFSQAFNLVQAGDPSVIPLGSPIHDALINYGSPEDAYVVTTIIAALEGIASGSSTTGANTVFVDRAGAGWSIDDMYGGSTVATILATCMAKWLWLKSIIPTIVLAVRALVTFAVCWWVLKRCIAAFAYAIGWQQNTDKLVESVGD